MDASQDIWFYAKGVERYGPFKFKDLRAIALQGQLDPKVDLVWQAGTPDWISAGNVPSLYGQPESPPLVKPAPRQELVKVAEIESKPVAATTPLESRSAVGIKEAQPLGEVAPKGSNRIDFFFGMLVLPLIVWGICVASLGLFGDAMGASTQQMLRWFVAVLPLTIVFLAVIRRLQNLEMNPWWFLGLMVPGLNLWIIYRCICAPESYAVHERMDRPGRLVGIVYWVGFTLCLLGVILSFQYYGLKTSDVGNTRSLSIWLKQTKERLRGDSSERNKPD